MKIVIIDPATKKPAELNDEAIDELLKLSRTRSEYIGSWQVQRLTQVIEKLRELVKEE